MAYINVDFEGRVGAEPRFNTVNGAEVANFSVAVTERKKNSAGEWEDGETRWVDVSAWRYLASVVRDTVAKGALVRVSGTVKVRTYETKEGGTGVGMSVNADSVSLIRLPKAAAEPDTPF